MSAFRQEYKRQRFGFGNTNIGRYIRAEKQEKLRKSQRSKAFNENRHGMELSPVIEDRRTRLLKWKAERDRRKKIQEAHKKPPFIVGTVHHKLYSPANKDEDVAPTVQRKKVNSQLTAMAPPPPKRITRATEKRLMSKTLTSKVTKASIKSSNPTENKEQKILKKQEQSFAPAGYKFKTPKGLHEVPLFGRLVPQSISPATISEFMSFSRMTRASRKSGTTDFKVEHINDKEYNVSLFDKEKDSDSNEDGSIEAIKLKLSSDEEETFDTFNNSKNNNDNDNVIKKEVNNETLNNSVNEANTILNNNVQEADKILNNSVKEANITVDNGAKKALVSSSNNTPKSVHSDSPNEPVFFSPYVVSSRGKSNARKEQQLKRGFSLGCSPSDSIPMKDTVMKNLNISVEEEERTAQYFQFLLNSEMNRLKELCEKWAKVTEVTEDGQYQINQAIGQTNLLLSKKFERFRSLVSSCETGKGEMLVTCKDLQGFWDMMYMEVKNCDSRFEKLEQLRSQGWVEEQTPVVSKPLPKKKIVIKKEVVPTKSRSIRAFLAERRKKMAQEAKNKDDTEGLGIINNETLGNKCGNNESSPAAKYKTRRSITVGSNDKKFTHVKREGKRLSLLQKVQLSQTKKLESPLAIIKISQMCKTSEASLNDTLSYVNSNQTPGKSILKQPKNSIPAESCAKTMHKVNFGDAVVVNKVPTDEETQMEMDLAPALARIDSFNFDGPDEELSIHAERKLNFADDSFENSENVFDAQQHSELNDSINKSKNELPYIQIQNATSLQESILNNSPNILSSKRVLRRQNNVDEDDEESHETLPLNTIAPKPFKEITDDADLNILVQKLQKQDSINDKEKINEHNESIRVLRNRSVTSTNVPNHKKKSSEKVSINVKESEHKENKTPLKTKRKSSLRISIKDDEKINSKIDLQDAIDNMSLHERSDKRRSSRRSVKFSEKECSGCTENKPVLPMTPYVRRSKVLSSEKKKRSIFGEDISEETPVKPSERVRRSQNRKE